MSVEVDTAGMSPCKGSKPKFWGVLHRECCCFVRGSWQRKREEPTRNDTGRLRAPTISGRDDYALDSHAPRPTGPYPTQPTRTVCTRKPCGAWEDVITCTPRSDTPTWGATFFTWTDVKEYAEGWMSLRGWIAHIRIPSAAGRAWRRCPTGSRPPTVLAAGILHGHALLGQSLPPHRRERRAWGSCWLSKAPRAIPSAITLTPLRGPSTGCPLPGMPTSWCSCCTRAWGLPWRGCSTFSPTWTGGGPPRFPLTSRWTARGCSRLWEGSPCRCNGLKSKLARTAINENWGPHYLHPSVPPELNYVYLRLQSAARDGNQRLWNHIICDSTTSPSSACPSRRGNARVSGDRLASVAVSHTSRRGYESVSPCLKPG